MYSITETAKKLNCSVQNIYNQKGELEKLGYLQETENGKEISEEGFNFLLQKRAKNSKVITPIREEKSLSEIEIENKFLKRELEMLRKQLELAQAREGLFNSREVYYQEQIKTATEDKDIFKAMLTQTEEKHRQLLLDTAENNSKKRKNIFKLFK